MTLPNRQTARLRWGRISASGATYFVTACTGGRAPVFNDATAAQRAIGALDLLHSTGDAEICAATIMPDHVHLLFTLGERLTLGQILAKFKTLSRDRGRASRRWQQDGFEHRLREHESIESIAFYIFMNPYRANILPLTRRWRWWFCPQPERFRFLSSLRVDEPIPAE